MAFLKELALKVVGNEKGGGREAGYCLTMVLERSDLCLFSFKCFCCLFLKVLPFPVCQAQLIGDCHENRRGALKCSVPLFLNFFYCSKFRNGTGG
jgi:hypothetical protein